MRLPLVEEARSDSITTTSPCQIGFALKPGDKLTSRLSPSDLLVAALRSRPDIYVWIKVPKSDSIVPEEGCFVKSQFA